MAQSQPASTIKKTFSRTTSVSTEIQADAATVWTLLTDAKDFPNWNSTVISIDGDIAVGEKIKLKSTLAPERTFKIRIKEMQDQERMVWGDAMGKRVFLIEKMADGVRFTMTEKISSPMFPLFANQLPSFDENFDTYAADLKRAAESK